MSPGSAEWKDMLLDSESSKNGQCTCEAYTNETPTIQSGRSSDESAFSISDPG